MKIPDKYQFIIELGKALHTYGIPSYKIQTYLTKVSKAQGINGTFMDLPTWINYVFYEDEQTYNYIECIPPGVLNLGALSRVEEVTNKIIANKIDHSEVETELKVELCKPFVDLCPFLDQMCVSDTCTNEDYGEYVRYIAHSDSTYSDILGDYAGSTEGQAAGSLDEWD